MASKAPSGRMKRKSKTAIQQPDRGGVVQSVSGGGLNDVLVRFESEGVLYNMRRNNFAELVAAIGAPKDTVLIVNGIFDSSLICRYYCHTGGVAKEVGKTIRYLFTEINTVI